MTDYFDNYYFTSKISKYTCPDSHFECRPPRACARDPTNGRRYCCDVPKTSTEEAVCWALGVECTTNGNTTDCGNSKTSWCCNNGIETCTETKDQINVCWATAHDTLNNITVAQLNETYSSLSKAKPSATSWIFTPINLVAATNPAITQSKTSSAGASITSHTTDPTEDSDSSSSGLKTGAIVGVAVGVAGAVALLGLGIFLLMKRQRKQKYVSVSSGPAPVYSVVAPHDKMGSGVGSTYSGAYTYPSPAPPSELGGGVPGGPVTFELSGMYGDGSHRR